MSAFPEPLQGLLDPGAYPHPVQAVHLMETHMSWILLTGEFAYKIKRPVHHPFVDLRSAKRREFLCHEELRLNQRFACELYLGVCQITSSEGSVRLDGSGLVIEHAIKMRQFRREDELDRLLEMLRIAPAELEEFGRDLAHSYTTIIDATFHRREDRAHFHDLSVRLGIAACVVRCEAPPEILRARIDARRQRGDASSEAGRSVLQWQEIHSEPVQAEELFVLFEAVTDRTDAVNTLTRQIAALAPSD
jgi:hypothetical protein